MAVNRRITEGRAALRRALGEDRGTGGGAARPTRRPRAAGAKIAAPRPSVADGARTETARRSSGEDKPPRPAAEAGAPWAASCAS